MEGKKKKELKPASPSPDISELDGVQALDDEDVEGVAGGFGLNLVNFNGKNDIEHYFDTIKYGGKEGKNPKDEGTSKPGKTAKLI